MNVIRAAQGDQPQEARGVAAAKSVPSPARTAASADTVKQPPGAVKQPPGAVEQPADTVEQPTDAVERVRVRIRAAETAARRARSAAAEAQEAAEHAESLRHRLPVATSDAVQAMRAVRRLHGFTPDRLRYAWRRVLAGERDRRGQVLRTALAERDELIAQIAERETLVRDRRAESRRRSAEASALPRLLDEAAVCLRREGGPAAEALEVAEAGLEPVLRRESDLDQAVRWVRWAQRHVGTALDRLGDRKAWTGYREFFAVPPDMVQRRGEAARSALGGVRDVFAVLGRALDGLGVSSEPLGGPRIPADLEPWFAGLVTDPRCRLRVIAALEDCDWSSVQLASLSERVQGDHAATRGVLESRRAQWGALLRGEIQPGR